MTTPVRRIVIAACLVTGVSALAATPTAPAPRRVPPRVLPERVFKDMVAEANSFIQEPFARRRLPGTYQPHLPVETIRANALLIALAAQNRMAADGVNGPKLATLRDIAVELGVEIEKAHGSNARVEKLAERLNRFPDITPTPDASLAPVRLYGPFNHDDVASLFGGCGGNKTQRVEFHLFKLRNQKTPYAAEQFEKAEMLGYKAALLAELIRDMDDLTGLNGKKTDERRAEWARFAADVQQHSWDLAATAGKGNSDTTRKGLTKLVGACSDCHNKFRE